VRAQVGVYLEEAGYDEKEIVEGKVDLRDVDEILVELQVCVCVCVCVTNTHVANRNDPRTHCCGSPSRVSCKTCWPSVTPLGRISKGGLRCVCVCLLFCCFVVIAIVLHAVYKALGSC
jgi:hypothetical protein